MYTIFLPEQIRKRDFIYQTLYDKKKQNLQRDVRKLQKTKYR